jgi:putative protein-disulfide isomerase
VATLYYFHDPMCSWCWGYRPVWQALKARLPAELDVENVLGGLAPDNDQPMPLELQMQIQAHWRRIETELGRPFNFAFWTRNQPRRSTYPACRAVLAAERQGREEAMIEAIQLAYYQRALNPSDDSVLEQLALELGLDARSFSEDLRSQETERKLAQQVAFSRAVAISGFPSLLLRCGGSDTPVAIDYRDHRPALLQITQAMSLEKN